MYKVERAIIMAAGAVIGESVARHYRTEAIGIQIDYLIVISATGKHVGYGREYGMVEA